MFARSDVPTRTNSPGMENNGISKSESHAEQEANELASAESDPGSFYSTQPVAEDLGFTRGRELVEGM